MRRFAPRDMLVFLGYAAVSFGYFGWRLLPHPGRALVGMGSDPLIFVWSFAWWPHAILHGTNPLVTHALYAPSGANLLWTTSVPALALAFSPVTLLFGPVASFDLAAVLLPALAAWSAYRLCLYLTRSLWASLLGGYLFGFSSFILAQQLQGHLNLTGAFVLPLLALMLVRRVRGELSGRGFAVLCFGALLALQLAISTEVTLTLTLVLLLGLLLALVLARDRRRELGALVRPLLAAYGLGALITSPLIVYAVLGFPHQGYSGAEESGTDLANLLVPTDVNAIAGSSFPSVTTHFNDHEYALYLGPPALLIIVLYAWRARRSPWSRVLVALLAVSALLAIGAVLRIDGGRVSTLPWVLTKHVPGLDNVHTTRFAVYVALAAAVIVALWTAQSRGRIYRRPYVLPLLAVIALVPPVWHPLYVSHPQRTPFFSAGLSRTCVPANETLLAFPFNAEGEWMLAQAETGFSFRLAQGYLTPNVFGEKPLESFDENPTVDTLDFLGYKALPTMTSLLGFAVTHGVGRIVSAVGDGYPSAGQMRRFGRVQEIGGVYVSPACGQPPLTSRALTPAVQQVLQEQQAGVEIGYCDAANNYYLLPAGTYPAGDIRGARTALLVAGSGLQCTHPAGYTRHGLAPSNLGVPADTYPYYIPRR